MSTATLGCCGIVLLLCQSAIAQGNAAPNPYAFLRKTKLVARFDKDRDGRLDRAERDAAREFLRTDRDAQRRRQMERMLSGAKRAPSEVAKSGGLTVRPADVTPAKDGPLYAPAVLRTLFLQFEPKDWLQELADFYKTDVEVPAVLTVDGRRYPGVGVRVRGTSSFLMVGNSKKKSFNLSVDHTKSKQRLRGFRTLNLLNGNQDPTFLREVLFSHIAQNYLPTPRVSYVRLVINEENWGVYQNAQQFNRDFIKDWFGKAKGHRWKIHRNQGGVGALRYLGEERAAYASTYELRGQEDPQAWRRLIRFCKILNETPDTELATALPKVLDVHAALWFCALESVLLPNDGYLNQGYDYRLFEARDGRFHLIPHDKNEILPQLERTVTRNGRTTLGLDASPLRGVDDPARPVFSQLLKVPAWRARYLAHVRHLTRHWLDWRVLGPVCRGYHDLIREEIYRDDKKLLTRRTFDNALELREGVRMRRRRRPLRWIIEARQKRLLADPALAGPWPAIGGVQHREKDGKTRVEVTVPDAQLGDTVVLYARAATGAPFEERALTSGALTPGAKEGEAWACAVTLPGPVVAYYVELRRGARSVFEPPAAAGGPRLVTR